MSRQSNDFWVEIIAKHCQNRSINIAYSVPKCGEAMKYIICGGNITKRTWCPRKLIQAEVKLIKGNLSIPLETHLQGKDSNYNAAIKAVGNPSTCKAARSKVSETFNFFDCPISPTTAVQESTLHSSTDLITGSTQIHTLDSVSSASYQHLSLQSRNSTLIHPSHSVTSLTSKLLPPQSTHAGNLTTIIFCLVIIGIFVALVFSVSYWVRKRLHLSKALTLLPVSNRDNCGRKTSSQELVPLQTKNKKTINVYLVFVKENPFHQKVVLAFTTFLQHDLGFHMIFEPWETRKASENYSMWMQNSMEIADKIIVVWSDGASEKIRAFQQNISNFPDTFSPVVQHMQSDLFKYKQVKKYSLVYFSYSDKNSIPPNIFNKKEFRHFELMQDFEELYFHLIDCEKNIPGGYNDIKNVKFESLFNPKINSNGPFLKKAIKNARKQIPLTSTQEEENASHSKESDEASSILNETGFCAELTDSPIVMQRTISLPSITAHSCLLKKRNLSIASMEELNKSSDTQYLLNEINKLTMLQEYKYNRQAELQAFCMYHNNDDIPHIQSQVILQTTKV